ncbi:beta-glucoside-specific PTS transporter subunit IIABC [Thomasclavelia sp.]|uniref:beta-glucoside-specific PTS transporter subunit IIABC n=1 Tax=Thomasclavelia sp. TaxID=3025757 RepID=UPI0025D2625B|nr:beta-glucoside-specific PTS transporter subunit IIABC [Thomasclavelia sp.]
MNNKELAEKILELVGGPENITALTHCITRLRLTIKDLNNVDEEEIKKLPGVMGTNYVETQYQIILGPKVADVFLEFEPLVGLGKQTNDHQEKKKLGSLILDTFTGIFTPILPAIIGAGLLKGILLGLMFANVVSADSDMYKWLMLFSDAAYYFMPFLLAVSTATHFKCNRYLAVVVAGIILHPDLVSMLSDGTTHYLLGIPVYSASYGSTVLPIILTIIVMSYIEKFFAKIVPSILRTILVPLLTIFVTGVLVLVAIGPIGSIISDILASNFLNFYINYGFIAGAIFSGLFPLMVLLGIHNGFTPVMVQSISSYGVEYLMGLNVSSNSAQAGATFAVFLKTKNKDFKSLAGTAALNAILGITEPALYGITTKLKRPLIGVCIGGAVGGAIAGLFHVTATGMGTGPIIGIPLFLTDTFIWFVVSCSVAFIVAFIWVMITGFEDVPSDEYDEQFDNSLNNSNYLPESIEVCSATDGKLITMEQIPDNVFSKGMMGQCFAIIPQAGKIYAPASGTISAVFPTNHAIGITSDDGLELLIHIGIDTVNMEGKGFDGKVKQGQRVNKGDLLVDVDVDLEMVKKAGYPDMVIHVVCNSNDFSQFNLVDTSDIKTGQPVLTLKK